MNIIISYKNIIYGLLFSKFENKILFLTTIPLKFEDMKHCNRFLKNELFPKSNYG